VPQDGSQGFKYQAIYKNFLTDFRNFLIESIDQYLLERNWRFKFKNPDFKHKFFPILIMQYVKDNIPEEFIHNFGSTREKVAFILGSFVQPKSVIHSLNFDKDKIKANCYRYPELLLFVMSNFGQMSKEAFKTKVLSLLTDDFFGVLKKLDMAKKKLKIADIYRYFYRFSIEKLQRFVENK